MKGDFTRLGFDPGQGFSRVLMQQGRVQLDSDWNEKQEMDLYAARTALRDGIAWAGIASGSSGFAIGVTASGNDLTIAPGRLYAGGIRCDNPLAGATLSNQPFLGLATATRAGLAWPAPIARTRYLVYLDVWERDVSALEQPGIRETALGGPDTATRSRVIWQVRLEPTDSAHGSEDFPPGWAPASFAGLPVGTVLASTVPPASGTGPCVLPPGARYTSLSNQLYRVEIQTSGWLGGGGPGSPPTFKWSRENGSVATTVSTVLGQTLSVADLGPDDRLAFLPGQVVELADDWMELSGQTGSLLLIDSVDPQAMTITIAAATPVPGVDLSRPVLLRRWDQPGTGGAAAQGVTVAGGPLALEAGIQLQFQPGFYRAGAWWTFAARTAIDAETGNVVWPAPAGTFLPPQGTPHGYVPLALVDYIPPATSRTPPAGQFLVIEDCRALFAPAAGRLAPIHARYAESGRQTPFAAGQSIRLDSFAQGLMLSTPVPLDSSSVSSASVQLLAELPVTMGQVIPGSTDPRMVGSQTIVLASSTSLPTPNRIVVTPSQAAQDMLTAALARRIATGSAADFVRVFATADFGPSPAAYAVWKVQSDGSVAQTNAIAAYGANGPSTPLTPSLALSTTVVTHPLAHAGVSYNAGGNTGDAGIVFNWTSNADFWVFYNSLFWQVYGYSGAAPWLACFVQHIVNGQVAASFTATNVGPQEDSAGRILGWSADLDIATSGTGLTFHAAVRWANGAASTFNIAPVAGTAAYPAAFVTGSRIGLMARGKGDTTYTRLQWTDTSDSMVNILPVGSAGPVLVRLIAKPSLLRTLQEFQATAQGVPPPRPAPEPDFETSFFVTAAPSAYYGSLAGGVPGIGSDPL